jgi:hypothetical protein
MDKNRKIVAMGRENKATLEKKFATFLPCVESLKVRKTISTFEMIATKMKGKKYVGFEWVDWLEDPNVKSCVVPKLANFELDKTGEINLLQKIIRVHAIPMGLKPYFAKGAEFYIQKAHERVSRNVVSSFTPGQGGAGKPVIYLYPKRRQAINIRLAVNGKIDVEYPRFNGSENSWDVVANADGRIEVEGYDRKFNYLFWEGMLNTRFELPAHDSFLVRGEDALQFLETELRKIGLTDEEANEFIVYWGPKMKAHPFNVVRFIGEDYERAAHLKVDPRPDSVLRVFMVFQGFSSLPNGEYLGQNFEKFKRDGFVVVEWGGDEIK